ncbi:MAG: hypothetical protein JNM39_06520 [Bdellovibrionaceae bacterium]|nr:hypothetical protein [Pseudobdellovibrionaceae bacterium]
MNNTFTFCFISVLTFCSTTYSFEEAKCEVEGQFVVFERLKGTPDSNLVIGRCQKDALGMSPMNDYSASTLLDIMESTKDKKEFFSALNKIGVGFDVSSAKSAVLNYGGFLAISGPLIDKGTLDYLAGEMNKTTGVSQAIEEKKKQKAAKKADKIARDNTPISIDMAYLDAVSKQNTKLVKQIQSSSCRQDSTQPEKELKILKVNFEDGEEGLGLLIKGKTVGSNIYEFQTLDSSSKGIGGLRLGGGWGTRQLIFEKGKIYWVYKGQQYPVKSFTNVTASEALGWARSIGHNAVHGDTCEYAGIFSKAADPQLPVGPAAAQ